MSDTDSMSDVTNDSIEQAITPVSGINNNRKNYNCILIVEESRPTPVTGNSAY